MQNPATLTNDQEQLCGYDHSGGFDSPGEHERVDGATQQLCDDEAKRALDAVRRTFHCFYGAAAPKEIAAMDALVLASQDLASPEGKNSADKDRSTAVHRFLRMRFMVRDCATFRGLALSDRSRIAAMLFDSNSPRPNARRVE
jgi:hypothetical protein